MYTQPVEPILAANCPMNDKIVTNNDGKLAYTGNSLNIVAITVSSVAAIALAAVIIKKRIAATAE